MIQENRMITVYNMGNFKTGKTAQTHDKQAVKTYELAGYKLISSIMVSLATYLKGTAK